MMSTVGSRLLTQAEVDALVDATLEAARAGDDEARRRALSIAADLLETGQPMPLELREWLAAALRDLHDALEAGGNAVQPALATLGRRKRGRSPRQEDDVALAAAVALLSAGRSKNDAVDAVARGCALRVDLVWDAVATVMLESDAPLRVLAQPVLERLLRDAKRRPNDYTPEILDLMRVT